MRVMLSAKCCQQAGHGCSNPHCPSKRPQQPTQSWSSASWWPGEQSAPAQASGEQPPADEGGWGQPWSLWGRNNAQGVWQAAEPQAAEPQAAEEPKDESKGWWWSKDWSKQAKEAQDESKPAEEPEDESKGWWWSKDKWSTDSWPSTTPAWWQRGWQGQPQEWDAMTEEYPVEMPTLPVAKARTRAKGNAKAKSKATAKSNATGKAKAKSTGRAKGKAKIKAKAKSS